MKIKSFLSFGLISVLGISNAIVTQKPSFSQEMAEFKCAKVCNGDNQLFNEVGIQKIYQIMVRYNIVPSLKESSKNDANFYILEGDNFLIQKEYDKAIKSFTKAIEISQNDAFHLPFGFFYRSIAYSYIGQWEKALVDAKKAAELFRQREDQVGYQKVQELISVIKQEMSK